MTSTNVAGMPFVSVIGVSFLNSTPSLPRCASGSRTVLPTDRRAVGTLPLDLKQAHDFRLARVDHPDGDGLQIFAERRSRNDAATDQIRFRRSGEVHPRVDVACGSIGERRRRRAASLARVRQRATRPQERGNGNKSDER